MKKIFISAGDPSGDIHAAKLMKELKNQFKDIEFTGIGGPQMTLEGLNPITDFKQLNVVGFWEVAKKIRSFYKLLNKCKKILNSKKFDLMIVVDYPGFNMKLIEHAKLNSVKVVYYIAPQLWAWGKNRAFKLKQFVDKLLVVFPFEEEFFNNFGISTKFVGHPLLDEPKFLDIDDKRKYNNRIAILAGSRLQEIKKHSKEIEQIIKKLNESYPDLKIGLSLNKHLKTEFQKNTNIVTKIEFWDDSKDLMLNSDIGLIKSGTSNLEAGLLLLPFVMFYKTSPLTYFIGKSKIKLPYLSIINILANKPVIKELIQNDFTSESVFNELKILLDSQQKKEALKNDLITIRRSLFATGASKNAAKEIIELL